MTLHKSKAVQKKAASNKNRKRDNSEPAEAIEVNAKASTRIKYFIELIDGIMDILDICNMAKRYLTVDNAVIYKVSELQELIESRSHKVAYMPPYSSFFNSIELFWSKLKTGVNRDYLTAIDRLSNIIFEPDQQVIIEDYQEQVMLAVLIFGICLVFESVFNFFLCEGFINLCCNKYKN